MALVTGLGAVAGAGAPAFAEQNADEMLVTATRVATPADQLGSSVTVITREDLDARQSAKVDEVLKSVPGVSVTRQGGMGAAAQIRIRGTDPNHTLVLIDGQRVNYQDTMYNFDFDWMLTDDIERIEVLRGPAAGQWGSDAVGGVVNIVTRKGKGPMTVTLQGELGTYDTNRETASARGGGDSYDYAFSWSRYRTAGWSIASEERGMGTERDGSQNNSFSGKLGFSPTDNSEIELRGSHTDFWAELDGSKSSGGTLDTMRSKAKHTDTGALKGSLALLDGMWTQTVNASAIRNDQWNMGGTTAGCTVGGPLCAAYLGTTVNASWQNDLRLIEGHVTTLGYEDTRDYYWQRQYQRKGKITSSSMQNVAPFFQHQAHLFDQLDLGGGWRGNDHDVFGWKPTWFTNAAWHLPTGTGTTLKASYGTSFKAPLLFQIYYPSGLANLGLQPEEGRGWDVGLEQSLLGERAKAGVTWFRNDIDNLINYVSIGNTGQYQNTAKATTYGVETFFTWTLYDDADGSLEITPSYTYTAAYDRATWAELPRRPRHKVANDLSWRFLDKRARLTLTTLYASNFQENRSTSSAVKVPNRMGEFVEFDVAGSYDLTDQLQLYGRIENVAEDYHESAYGYAETGGRAVYAGVKLSFQPVTLAREAMK